MKQEKVTKIVWEMDRNLDYYETYFNEVLQEKSFRMNWIL